MRKSKVFSGFVNVATLAVAVSGGQAAVKVSGQLRDIEGRPLAGYVEVVAGPGRVEARSHPTDAQGRFAIESANAARLIVVARAEGHVSAEREIVVSGTEAAFTVDFSLPPAGWVTGRVTDTQGFPVAGAKVRVEYPGEVRRLVYETEVTAETDADGYFTLRYVARGRPFVLAASAEGRPPSFAGPFTLNASRLEGLVLTAAAPGETVRVRVVTPTGQPAAGAAVRLWAAADLAAYTAEQRRTRAFFEATQRLAFAGPDGWVEFGGLPPGKVTVVASRPGAKGARVEADLVSGQALSLGVIVP